MGRKITINPEVAMFVDWLITMHNYDVGLMEMLLAPEFIDLRRQVAKIVLSEREGTLELSDELLERMLVMTPITFRFNQNDVGFELKLKLFEAVVGKPIKMDWEAMKTTTEVEGNVSNDNTQDETKDYPTYSP